MSKSKPLILSFVGLSGHGKTELANQVGDLLSVKTLVVDMTQIRHETDLFGCLPPYMRYDKGSTLNNFLGKHSGERTVVFLDEFDKTQQEVRESLLLVLDSGRYRDHRNNNMVDASNTIWIFATNLGTVPVKEFYTSNLEGKKTTERVKISLAPLLFELSQLFMTHYTPAVTGRINAIVPFFPFHLGEQAVVAHKFLLQLMREVRLPVDLSHDLRRYVGHLHLAPLKDSQLCVHIARQYIQDLGARSLANAVDGIGRKLFVKYADTDEEVTERVNEGPLQKFSVQFHPVKDDVHEIVVFPDGDTYHYREKSSPFSSCNSEADPNDLFEGSDEDALDGAEKKSEF